LSDPVEDFGVRRFVEHCAHGAYLLRWDRHLTVATSLIYLIRMMAFG
jgi:hypothetical protein